MLAEESEFFARFTMTCLSLLACLLTDNPSALSGRDFGVVSAVHHR